MAPAVDQFLKAALALPDEEQLQLVAALVAAVDERGLRPFYDCWLEEIQRRSAAYDAGAMLAISGEQVKEKANHGLT